MIMIIARHERKILPFTHNSQHIIRGTLRNDKFKKYLSGTAFLYLK